MAGNDDRDVRAEAEARAALAAMTPRLGEPPHALLGVPPGAPPEALRQAFLRLTKRFHPTRFARFSPEVVRTANEVFLTIKRAYDGLAAGAPRRAPTATAAPPPVAAAASPPARTPAATAAPTPRARTVPGTGAPSRPSSPAIATPPARRSSPGSSTPPQRPSATAIPKAPAAPRPSALDAAHDLLQRRLWAEARQAFLQLAIAEPQERRHRAYMHYARGREAHDAGRVEEARTELQRALALDPDLAAARRALDELPPPPSGGLLSRLFKR